MPELLELYQGQRSLPKSEGVPEGPQRKNHVTRPVSLAIRFCHQRNGTIQLHWHPYWT